MRLDSPLGVFFLLALVPAVFVFLPSWSTSQPKWGLAHLIEANVGALRGLAGDTSNV